MVNNSMTSRPKFSFGAPFTFCPASRKTSMAGSWATAISSSRKFPVAFLLEQLELDEHLAIVADLVGAGGEVSVPEQRHLLLQAADRWRPCGRPTIAATRRVSSAVARSQ